LDLPKLDVQILAQRHAALSACLGHRLSRSRQRSVMLKWEPGEELNEAEHCLQMLMQKLDPAVMNAFSLSARVAALAMFTVSRRGAV
jgi:hypothetical protein